MTEGDPGAASEKTPTASLVDRDTATRRARRVAVQFEVGELGFALRSVRNREVAPAFNSHWHLACYGWRVAFNCNPHGFH